jgi:hypothetical protein
MSRSLLVALMLAMLSSCIMLPREVASELEPAATHGQDHFHKP